MRVKLLLLFMLLTAFYSVQAQRTRKEDTVLKASTIEVLQSYKPQVKQAPKPEWIPQLPPTDTTHPTFSYDVPQQTLYYTYSSLPLRPLALGREPVPVPFANYIKGGYGNLSTIFLDAGIGGIKGKNFETDIHLHHISQKGGITHQQSSLSGLEAEGIFHGKKMQWRAMLNGAMNQYYYYGYNHDLLSFSADSVKQTYTTIRAAIEMKNVADAKTKFTYNPSVKAAMYTAAQSTSEPNINVRLPFEYKFDNTVQAMLALTADYAHLTTKDTSRDNTIAAVLPGIRIRAGVFTGHAILGYAVGINSNNYILPDIKASVALKGNKLIMGAGFRSSLRQNTYEQLTTENPYMFNAYALRQTRKDESYGEVAGGVGEHFAFAGRVSWLSFNALPVFLNDFGDAKQFSVLYDTVNALAFQLSARYKVADKWSAGVSAEVYNFTGGKQAHVWHVPAMRIKGDYTARLLPKLAVSVYLSALGGIYARDFTGKTILLDPVLDLGGSAEYQIVKRLSAFVQVNNLLNNTYQRWYGYEAYGLNIYGGFRLKF